MTYEALLETSPQATIFCQPWWLEAVAPGNHRIVTSGDPSSPEAAWPLVERRSRAGRPVFGMPPLTPWLGILFSPPTSDNLANRLAREKKLTQGLLQGLPRSSDLHSFFHPNFDYWLPLHWAGFSQTTWYSYALTDLSDEARLWEGMHKNVRQTINKARSSHLSVEETDDLDEFWKVYCATFSRQGLGMPHARSSVDRIDEACAERGVRRILLARSRDGSVHAGAYVVWDQRSAYYLMGGADPATRSSGAASLLLWEAIRFASGVTGAFDFEGSSVEPIERFFRSFGATPRPYYEIRRTDSFTGRLRRAGRILLSKPPANERRER